SGGQTSSACRQGWNDRRRGESPSGALQALGEAQQQGGLLRDALAMALELARPHAPAPLVRLPVDQRRTVVAAGLAPQEQRVAGGAVVAGQQVPAHAGPAP